jgi:hypothetical protein
VQADCNYKGNRSGVHGPGDALSRRTRAVQIAMNNAEHEAKKAAEASAIAVRIWPCALSRDLNRSLLSSTLPLCNSSSMAPPSYISSCVYCLGSCPSATPSTGTPSHHMAYAIVSTVRFSSLGCRIEPRTHTPLQKHVGGAYSSSYSAAHLVPPAVPTPMIFGTPSWPCCPLSPWHGLLCTLHVMLTRFARRLSEITVLPGCLTHSHSRRIVQVLLKLEFALLLLPLFCWLVPVSQMTQFQWVNVPSCLALCIALCVLLHRPHCPVFLAAAPLRSAPQRVLRPMPFLGVAWFPIRFVLLLLLVTTVVQRARHSNVCSPLFAQMHPVDSR